MSSKKPGLHFGKEYWNDKGVNANDFNTEEKLHLIFSLLILLEISLAQFLHFMFSSAIADVRKRAGMFLGYRPSARTSLEQFAPAEIYRLWHTHSPKTWQHLHTDIVHGCGKEIAVEESDNIINDPELKISIKDFTIASIQELLSPSAIATHYQDHAPFTWDFLYAFSASPNCYQKEKAAKQNNSDVEMEDATTANSSKSEDFNGEYLDGERFTTRMFEKLLPCSPILVCN